MVSQPHLPDHSCTNGECRCAPTGHRYCCLDCPLAVCILDVPWKEQEMRTRIALVKALKADGLTGAQIAIAVGVSPRSIYYRRENKKRE